MDPVWVWDEDRMEVFKSLLRRFAAAQKSPLEMGHNLSDQERMNLLLTHGMGEDKLKEDRAVLHGIAIGLGLSPEEAGKIAKDWGVSPILVQFHK